MARTVIVWFQAEYTVDLEVPDDWEPTSENLKTAGQEAFSRADFSDGSVTWDLESLDDGDQLHPLY